MIQKSIMMILCALNLHNGQRCSLNSRYNFGQPLPVIFRNGRLLEPDDASGTVSLAHGETLTISCERGGYIDHPQAQRQEVTASITCEAGDNFRNNDWLSGPATFSRFLCSYPPSYTVQRTNQTCYASNQVYEAGYNIQGEFHPLYETCFDEENLTPIFSKYTQKSFNANYQTRVERPFFIAEDVYGTIPVNDLFRPGGLRNAVASHVGSAVERYVTNNQMLSRGHLAAKTDFVFAFGQRATFHYINCAPQWTGFNGGNWNTLEVDLRNHVNNAGYDTVVYTGTFGVSQLRDDSGRKVNLYLYTDYNNNPVIPVPLYFYKLVYSPSTKRGTAFVGINNPHLGSDEARSLFFCEDLCRGSQDFRWLTWHPDNPQEGYTFCCTVPDFRNAVPHLPFFEIIAAIAIIITVHETNAALDTSKLRVNLENNRPAYEPTKIKPEDRRKLLSLFPKHTAKFIITTEQPIRTTHKGHSQTFIKKPLLRKNDFKTTTESNQYNQKVTSMKAKKFSIQEEQKIKRVPTLNNNLNPMWPKTQIIKNEQNYAKRQEPNLRNGEVFSESLEEDTTGETIIEDVEIEMTSKDLPPTSTKKIARKYPGFKRPKRDSFLIGNEIFISNENQLDENFVEDLDQIEFIFIDNAEQNELNKGNLSSGEESTDAPIYFQGKPKRSIIEEENLASTIPSFTYTGRDVVLRDELSYRNINE